MFLGITPNLHLFRYFYFLRANMTGGIIGSFSFRLRTEKDLEPYIPLPIRSKWDNWAQNWCYIMTDNS